MPTTADTLRLERRLRDALGRITDEQTRDLVAAWVKAWDEVAGDLNQALIALLEDAKDGHVSRALMLRNRRLQKALGVVAEHLDELVRDSRIRVTSDLQAVVDHAGAAQARIIASTLPSSQELVDLEAWSRVDDRAIAAIVRRSTQQITARHKPISDEAYEAVRRELIRGVAAGQNPKSTAARMVRRVEGRFNGGLSRAINIARTETLDAHREAARLGQAQHSDVLAGWVWLCTFSKRTCPACLSMHGQEFPQSTPGPEGHQQCRCARSPKTKSWADLGFPELDEPADAMPDAAAFFTSLSKADQVAILGTTGHAAWAAGRWPMSSWAVKRSTRGWRDSYVVASPPS